MEELLLEEPCCWGEGTVPVPDAWGDLGGVEGGCEAAGGLDEKGR